MEISNPFVDIGHKTYKKNFLRHVEFSVEYSSTVSVPEFKQKTLQFVKSSFNVDMNFNEEDGCELSIINGDKSVIFTFGPSKLSLSFSGKVYLSFLETAYDYLEEFSKFLECFDNARIKTISVKKNNSLNILYEDLDKTLKLVYSNILNEGLVKDLIDAQHYAANPPEKWDRHAQIHYGEGLSSSSSITIGIDKDHHTVNTKFDFHSKFVTDGIGCDDLIDNIRIVNHLTYILFISTFHPNLLKNLEQS